MGDPLRLLGWFVQSTYIPCIVQESATNINSELLGLLGKSSKQQVEQCTCNSWATQVQIVVVINQLGVGLAHRPWVKELWMAAWTCGATEAVCYTKGSKRRPFSCFSCSGLKAYSLDFLDTIWNAFESLAFQQDMQL